MFRTSFGNKKIKIFLFGLQANALTSIDSNQKLDNRIIVHTVQIGPLLFISFCRKSQVLF